MKIVTVKFKDYEKKYYDYIIPEGVSLAEGDFVTVIVGQDDWPKVCKVVSVKDENTNNATRPIVCKIITGRYKEWVEKDKRKKDVKRLLDAKIKEANEVMKYEFLRSYDPEAAKLIDELKGM